MRRALGHVAGLAGAPVLGRVAPGRRPIDETSVTSPLATCVRPNSTASICTPTSPNTRSRREQFGDYGREEKMSIALPAVRTQIGEHSPRLKIDAVRTSGA